jgi:hypothetical protein
MTTLLRSCFGSVQINQGYPLPINGNLIISLMLALFLMFMTRTQISDPTKIETSQGREAIKTTCDRLVSNYCKPAVRRHQLIVFSRLPFAAALNRRKGLTIGTCALELLFPGLGPMIAKSPPYGINRKSEHRQGTQ